MNHDLVPNSTVSDRSCVYFLFRSMAELGTIVLAPLTSILGLELKRPKYTSSKQQNRTAPQRSIQIMQI